MFGYGKLFFGFSLIQHIFGFLETPAYLITVVLSGALGLLIVKTDNFV